jgi:hypothetical protein
MRVIISVLYTYKTGNIFTTNIHVIYLSQALLVWMENFTPMVLNPVCLVAGLINCLQFLPQPLNSKPSHTTSSKCNDLTSDNIDDQNNEPWRNFATLTLQCMQCLLRENKVRDPASYTIALGIPIALNKDKQDQQIQENASCILRGLFIENPKLFSSTIYQLCMMTSEGDLESCSKQNSASESSVAVLFDKVVDSNQRLRLVHAIINIAKGEDILDTKLKEVDRALTEEILRNNNSSFVVAAIDALDRTSDSAEAIRRADELGILNTLDSKVSNKLRKRLTLGHASTPATKKKAEADGSVKKNKRKHQ